MENAENKYPLLLEFIEEQMFWESGHRNASYIMKLCRLEVANAPAPGVSTTRNTADVTARSHRFASLSPDCSWYQSDWSRMSATAASLRTIRGLFTGVEPVPVAC
jgi:hypothetical protein